MALTEFGKVVRKARIDVNESLGSMATALGVSSAFLSGIETGRKNIPETFVTKVQGYFKDLGVLIPNLQQLADVSNQSVPLDGLSPQQQMLVAGFARSSVDAQTLKQIAELLEAMEEKKNGV